MMGQRVTLKDVAQEAKVTVTAVSAALNGTGRVSEVRRKEIQSIAARLNYEPHIGAKLLKAKSIRDVGLIINERSSVVSGSGLFQSLMTSFSRHCALNEIEGRIEMIDASLGDNRVPQTLSGGLIGGALLSGVVEPCIWEWLREHPNFPYVIVEETGDYSVSTDMSQGIEQAVQYLAALGHTQLALIHGPSQFPPHAQASKSFRRTTAHFGMAPIEDGWTFELKEVEHDVVIDNAVEWATKLLTTSPRPTAIIANGVGYARACVYAALSLGLRVPQDLSIIAQCADWEAEKSCPPLTAIQWDPETTIKQALDLLQRRMQDLRILEPKITTTPAFTIRRTTAPPPLSPPA